MDDWSDHTVVAEVVSNALRTDDPVMHLRESVARAVAAVVAREVVEAALTAQAASLRESDQDEQEDVVLDVLDFLVGWCSPHLKI